MKKVTVLCSFALVAMCALTAQAQMPDPQMPETIYASYDLSALKGGEWVEYEMSMMGGAMKSKYKLACVGVEGDTVWIESDQMVAQMHPGTTILCGVDKKSGKVTKALWGKPGEAGKEITIMKAEGTGGTPQEGPKITGTGKVSKETIKVKDTDFDCEKIDMDTTMKGQGYEVKSKTTMWSSEKVAFKAKGGEEATKQMGDIKWEGKPEGKGGLVKMVSEANSMKTEITLIGWGTDAKKSLK